MTDTGTQPQMEPRPEGRRQLPFHKLQQFIEEVLYPRHFRLFSPFAERHGSWEVTFSCSSRELIRFVSVALTNEFAPSILGPDVYTLELWIGADSSSPTEESERSFSQRESSSAYTRRIVTQCKVSDDAFESSEFSKFFSDALIKAADIAEDVRPTDLAATYDRVKMPTREIP